MKKLQEIIKADAIVRSESILDVKGFLNEQVDPQLMHDIGKDFANHFKDYDFDAFITVEASGIAPAIFASYHLDKPLIIIKKEDHKKEALAQQKCHSFTKNKDYYLSVSSDKISNQRFILIDDFLATGNVVLNIKELLKRYDSTLVATGICISKNFQNGYKTLTERNFDLYCQVQLKQLLPEKNQVIFA